MFMISANAQHYAAARIPGLAQALACVADTSDGGDLDSGFEGIKIDSCCTSASVCSLKQYVAYTKATGAKFVFDPSRVGRN